ncbi:SDR family oxidoreductase [Streptomyces sp. cmx-10-25]
MGRVNGSKGLAHAEPAPAPHGPCSGSGRGCLGTEQQFADRAPLRRVAEADDVARAIAMLVGEDARFVTGAVVPVDGGATVSRM